MRILSPEKKYLYYLMISQLHEDGYTQQAVQLEVSTLYSSGAVKASDKLGRLFSTCLLSVNEATNYFNAKGGSLSIAGKKRHSTQSAINIRAANLANMAKRRRTAASLDSTNLLQDSIKKCVKLVTNDLQKATADITPGIASASSSLNQAKNIAGPSRHLSPKSNRGSLVAKQLLSPRSKINNKNIANVSNSFLKGISLLKSSPLPTVTPYSKSLPAGKSKGATPGCNAPGSSKITSVAAQILANQRMTSDSASVVRVTKNISNDPVTVIDVEAPSVLSSAQHPGLQLTQPVPSNSVKTASQQATNPPPSSMNKPVLLTVGQNKATSLKSLVNKISKKPILSIPRKSMSQQAVDPQNMLDPSKRPTRSNFPIVVLDDASPVKQSTSTASPTPTTPTTPTRRPQAASPRQLASPGSNQQMGSPNPVLNALGLQPTQPSGHTVSHYPNHANNEQYAGTPQSYPGASTSQPLGHANNATSPQMPGHARSVAPQYPAQHLPPTSPIQAQSPRNAVMSPPPRAVSSSPIHSPRPSSASPATMSPAHPQLENAQSDASVDVKPPLPLPPEIPTSSCSCDDPDLKYPIHTENTIKKDNDENGRSRSSAMDFPAEIFAEESTSKPSESSSVQGDKTPEESPIANPPTEAASSREDEVSTEDVSSEFREETVSKLPNIGQSSTVTEETVTKSSGPSSSLSDVLQAASDALLEQ